MYVKCRCNPACVTACTLLLALAAALGATELRVTVTQADGRPMSGAVVVAEPSVPAPRPLRKVVATIDQRNLMFVPEILVIRTGSDVEFPNSDQVRHQVYSFSAPKRFQLPLYAGREHAPVNFDKPGLVTLGCNIHDSMIGYIYVTDSPWFGRTGGDGKLRLDVPAGQYTVTVQYPRIVDGVAELQRPVSVGPTAADVGFRLQKPVRPAPHMHGADSNWEEY
jgi:plastocyanin